MLKLICVFTASSSNLTGKQRPENWRTDVVWLLDVWRHQHLAPAWLRVSRGVWPRGHLIPISESLSPSPPLLSPSIWACCETLTCSKTYRIPLFSLIWGCHTWFKPSYHGKPGVPPPAHTQTHTFPHQNAHLETRHCAPVKTNLFWCDLMILHHFANKMFYAVAYLPPGSLKRSGASHNAATVNQISFQFHFKGSAINN